MYKGNISSWLKHLDFMILDIILLELSFFIAYDIRLGTLALLSDDMYRQMSFILVLIDILVVFLNSTYQDVLKRSAFVELKKTITHVSVVIIMCLAYMFFAQTSIIFSRLIFGYTFVIATILMYMGRVLYKAFFRNHMAYHMNRRQVVAVTRGDRASEVIDRIKNTYYRNYSLAAVVIVGDEIEAEEIEGIPVIPYEQGIDYLKTQVVDEVLFYTDGEKRKFNKIVEACTEMGITLHMIIMENYNLRGEKSVEEFAGYAVLTSAARVPRIRQMVGKRIMDIAGGIVGCIITGILFIFVAPIVKIQSPGPIFFAQKRVGRNGRTFTIYKFRSMYTDAEERKKELMAQNEMDGLMFKMKNDPRIFPFGKFIRKTSIDEFPQFLNVLKGDMSLVGTRPPTMEEYEQYDAHHKKRLVMKPGITGMWQVSGRSDITDFEEVVRLDTLYLDNWSIGFDIKIILKTALMIFKPSGAV